MTSGQSHMLALGQDNQVYATGSGEYGKLGLGDTADEPTFAPVEFIDKQDNKLEISKVQCASSFSGALSTNGILFLWGRNDQGQMGLGEESMLEKGCHFVLPFRGWRQSAFRMLCARCSGSECAPKRSRAAIVTNFANFGAKRYLNIRPVHN